MLVNGFRARVLLCAGLLCGAMAAVAAPTSLIYVASSNALYSYDAANGFAETMVTNQLSGAYNISAGPAANTIYYAGTGCGFVAYNLLTNAKTNTSGCVWGEGLGEGRDGYVYSGWGTGGLYRVDPATGVSSLVGYGTYDYAGDLAVDPLNFDLMYGTVKTGSTRGLVTIDKKTGAQNLIGTITGVPGDVLGLGFSLDGTLFALGRLPGQGTIYTLDRTSGVATLGRRLSYDASDMASQPFSVAESLVAVPEPAPLALLAMGLLGVGLTRRWVHRAT